MQIIVNGEETEFEGELLSHEQAVELAFPANGNAVSDYTVYFKGSGDPKIDEGALQPNSKVRVKHNMGVSVSFTNSAPAG